MPRRAIVLGLAVMWPALLWAAEPGLVGYWNFDGSLEEGAGRSRDVLTAREGNPRFVDSVEVPGVVGKAVALGVRPADAQYLVADASDDIRLGPSYTIEAWIQPTELSTWNRLVLRWGAAPNYAYHLAIHDGLASLYHNPADGKYLCAEGGRLTTGQWYHLAGVARQQGTLTIYLNGRPVGMTPFNGTIRPVAEEGLGIGDSPGIPAKEALFRGYVDEVVLWNRALAANEIAAHYAKRGGGVARVGAGEPETRSGPAQEPICPPWDRHPARGRLCGTPSRA